MDFTWMFKEEWMMGKIENDCMVSNYYNNILQKQQREIKEGASKKAGRTEGGSQTGKTKLSKKAQNLLEKLRQTYGNMDFMVADFDSSKEAREILSRGTKEVSVLFSSKELEKMASDEKYEKEYMERVHGALRMSEQINREFGFQSAFGTNREDVQITKIGIAWNEDGTMTFFADLEKSSERQRERMEKTQEKNKAREREEAKRAENTGKDRIREKTEGQYEQRDLGVKRTTLWGNTMEELVNKLRNLDWNAIETGKKEEDSRRFDFRI